MSKLIELKIKDNKRIYQELTQALSPYKAGPQGTVLFIVEGTKKKTIIGIRYPGKKLRKRTLKIERANSALWANLYDFEVVPYKNGKELNTQDFTFELLMRDFQENKRNNKKFWEMLEKLYNDNSITKKPPKNEVVYKINYIFLSTVYHLLFLL